MHLNGAKIRKNFHKSHKPHKNFINFVFFVSFLNKKHYLCSHI